MNLKPHQGISLKQFSIFLFVLLNCLFTAIPLIHANSENNTAIHSLISPIQNNVSDIEEGSHLNTVLNGRINHSQVSRNQLRYNYTGYYLMHDKLHNPILWKDGTPKFAGSQTEIRHAYYSFLSLYHLY